MRIDNSHDDDGSPDFFNDNNIPQDTMRKKREPRLSPDDPKYWEIDRKPWQVRRRVNWGLLSACLVALIVIGTCIGFYVRFFVPYADDCTEYGYIESIEERGVVFKTYEGVLISYKALMDSTREYKRDFIFSTPNSQLGKVIATQARNGKPVMLKYKRYNATVPWRGETKTLVISVDTIDPRKILPPDVNPYK